MMDSGFRTRDAGANIGASPDDPVAECLEQNAGQSPDRPAPDETRRYVEHLVNTYSDLVLRLSHARLGSTYDAQDICQTVFLKLLTRSEGGVVRFESPEHEKAWIIRATINACIDLHRSRWRSRVLSLDDETTSHANERRSEHSSPMGQHEINGDGAVEDAERDADVLQAVNTLPPKYRQAVYLHYFEGYSVSEIAQLTGEREGTVRKHLSRARAKLRDLLEGDLR